jgi:serine/threonine-protein kinase
MVESIGPYQVEGEIGRGGMGVVYRATDPRLDRAVAIKALPADLAGDADRLARFEIEARTLASLNHPNVAGIHGVEEAQGQRYLVLELVEGETLAELLARGPLPLDQALDLAVQIASGLEAAHEAGIIHRDLKPGNVKITPQDKAKVLDFGLAKTAEAAQASSGGADSPTMSGAARLSPTLPGVIMGTAGYMSPEQARGKPVDKRSDIFAFGCVLYEMLSGAGPFGGETVTDSLGAVLHREPEWSKLPVNVPPRLRLLLERCLSKDRDRRLHDIADARIEIEDLRAGGGEPAPRATARTRPWVLAAAFVAGLALAAGTMWLALRPASDPRPVRRFELSGMGMPIDAFQGLALSPDGSMLIVRARDEDGNEMLQVRSFDTFELEPLANSESGWLPFFSPDGQKIGFFAMGQVRTVSLHGGLARTITDTNEGFSGGVWLPDDTIVFAGLESNVLFRVSADGGEVETIEVDGVGDDFILTSPALLPGGKAMLCGVRRGSRFDVAAFGLAERKLHVVAENGFTPVWAASGHVLFQQGVNGPLVALPFDPDRLVATGPPLPVLSDLGARVSFQVRMFSVADDGTLAFIPRVQRPDRASLVWLDASGQESSIAEIDRVADTPRVSHDGTRIAFRAPAPDCDIWVHDLRRGTTTRVTREGDNHGVAWWPDDRRIAFARVEPGADWGVLSASSDGAGNVERHSESVIQRGWLSSISPDAKHMLAAGRAMGTNSNVELVSLEDGKVRTLLDSRFDEEGATFSPNGRFIAYSSNDSGRNEIYVQPFPALDTRTQVSNEGGSEPVWSRDGTKIYFRRGRTLFAAEVQTSPVFSAVRPVKVLEADFATAAVGMPGYDVSPDGKRFAVFRSTVGQGQVEVKVILNWFEELKALGAAGS